MIDGQPMEFMADTGASGVVLSKADAERLGINLADLVFAGQSQTANGIVRTARVRLADVTLGPFHDESIGAFVNEGDMDGSLLGMDFGGPNDPDGRKGGIQRAIGPKISPEISPEISAGAGLQRIKPDPQRAFFFPLAIVPWPALKAHHQNIIANEMRLGARLDQPQIGGICPHVADIIRGVDPGAGKGGLGRGAKIEDRGDRIRHGAQKKGQRVA
eukprot:gene7722-9557_t